MSNDDVPIFKDRKKISRSIFLLNYLDELLIKKIEFPEPNYGCKPLKYLSYDFEESKYICTNVKPNLKTYVKFINFILENFFVNTTYGKTFDDFKRFIRQIIDKRKFLIREIESNGDNTDDLTLEIYDDDDNITIEDDGKNNSIEIIFKKYDEKSAIAIQERTATRYSHERDYDSDTARTTAEATSAYCKSKSERKEMAKAFTKNPQETRKYLKKRKRMEKGDYSDDSEDSEDSEESEEEDEDKQVRKKKVIFTAGKKNKKSKKNIKKSKKNIKKSKKIIKKSKKSKKIIKKNIKKVKKI